jgi:hypothetical protein
MHLLDKTPSGKAVLGLATLALLGLAAQPARAGGTIVYSNGTPDPLNGNVVGMDSGKPVYPGRPHDVRHHPVQQL